MIRMERPVEKIYQFNKQRIKKFFLLCCVLRINKPKITKHLAAFLWILQKIFFKELKIKRVEFIRNNFDTTKVNDTQIVLRCNNEIAGMWVCMNGAKLMH